jgi:hypothetical protein
LRRALGAILERGARVAFASASRENAELLARFARAWAGSSRSLWSARVAATLHAAATALVLGALCSMYVRGVVLEYRAGWESTFLGAPGVHAIITTVLGPAAQLSGIALPNVAQLAALADAAGPGENAARWIHLYAITLALVVILPRSILALVAASRARRLGRNFALPLDDDYFVRLRRAWSGRPTTIEVLPYSYHVNAAQGAALRTALERLVAPKVELKLLDTAPLGAEDNLGRWLGADRSSDPGGDLATSPLLAVLFSMAATPEREHHGALLRALTAHRPRQRLLAIVDESTMRRRLPGAEHVARLEERRRAWRTLLGDAGPSPVFIDLDATGEARAAGASSSATRS